MDDQLYRLLPGPARVYSILFGHQLLGFSFGRHSGTCLGFVALSLWLTDGSIAYRVHSIQQHWEEEVGHRVSLSWSASSHLSFSPGKTDGTSAVRKRGKGEGI